MIKIAFFDVDGTLLRLGHKELSANTATALRQLHQNGIILCMATGRSYTGVPHFDGIDFDEKYQWLFIDRSMKSE